MTIDIKKEINKNTNKENSSKFMSYYDGVGNLNFVF